MGDCSNTAPSFTKRNKQVKKPLDLLNIVMYSTKKQWQDGTVDQAYEDLRKWIISKDKE